MKNIGIWMDKQKAFIITMEDQKERIDKIPSNVEDFRIHGGSGTRIKGGPQDVVQDRKYLEREKHQFRTYFETLVTFLQDADKIVVFGPAEAGEKFKKELDQNYKDIAVKVEGVFKADSMTENQTKALIRDHFSLSTS